MNAENCSFFLSLTFVYCEGCFYVYLFLLSHIHHILVRDAIHVAFYIASLPTVTLTYFALGREKRKQLQTVYTG